MSLLFDRLKFDSNRVMSTSSFFLGKGVSLGGALSSEQG